ncbi:sulfurtransferase TusA family protein [Isoptericola sp. 4D.3]|uniref:Sulfurtransferase TusA family protein n=1 Tax=Isoptericola peretonis TaxID=2918523 RepID=A0ABT0J1G9_9MICO|nr:sulfurtransferase TusA family protein [Isoptericola sp. 4D.3]
MSGPGADDRPGSRGVVVDARGLRCPLPVIRLAAAARDLAPGALVTVLSTDPAARHDVPAWARMRGHTMADERHADPSPTAAPGEAGQAEGDRPTWALTVRLGPGG